MKIEISPMCDHILHTPCKNIPVDQILSEEVQNNIRAMLKFYENLPAVGLAAPQVGWDARVFLIGIDDAHSREDKTGMPLTVFINPTLEIIDHKKSTDWEGCFSVYNDHDDTKMLGQVSRFKKIRFTAYNLQGELFQGEFTNFRARVFQHEYDHLEGIRYINRMNDTDYLLYAINGRDTRIRMRDLHKIILEPRYAEIKDIVPILARAPLCSLSIKIRKRLFSAFRNQ